ncbi:Uncharacterized protein BP5553_02495 [Venustampulla echinocandica]|uniref:Aminoglycoside phosphotransferase domain-containing protein n=1 Tax=Venustampulla echinocandica TaxID=2656787 RepID=A0A370U417_9HELO|nr:Uncharacterized protein BP5553_02495 [Venustampulla echinocandica]RDL42516.1 Uncharacterized protein BP5553_02495 [Venustampulla echinocandica]
MDDGSEIVAKLPNPMAGPAYYTTASEVATREFLRDVLNIPTPRIISWSADRNNPVGAEYILEEKAPGRPLGSLWCQWPMKFKLEIMEQIVEIEQRLASTKFVKSGCIYFRDDIAEEMSSDNAIITSMPWNLSLLKRFKLGPLVFSDPWRGDRTHMGMNRGPYNGSLEFIEAMATNEMRFIKTHARPRMNCHRSSTEPELPEEVLDLLDRYLQLTPAMVPPVGTDDIHSPTLWHPDLHLNNQSAAVMPLFYQCGIPRMIQHRGTVADDWTLIKLPEDYDSLGRSEKKIDHDRMSETCHKYHEAETKSRNPRHWAALQLENSNVRTQPSRLAVDVWEDRDVFFLRRALLSIVELWQDLCPGSVICPVSFSEQELALHAAEEESMADVGKILRLFRDNWGLLPNGMVDPTEFDQIHTAVAELRDSFIGAADDEAEREPFARLWPYQDADS